jgi:hypothetical protein
MSVRSRPIALVDPKQLPTTRGAPFDERIAQAASEALGLSRARARLLAEHYLDQANSPSKSGFLHWIRSGRFQP